MLVPLEATDKAGTVVLRVDLPTGERVLSARLVPAKRDWIVVGLAEATLGEDPRGTQAALSDPRDDARLAAYAKGVVKGDWLVTAAIDTDKDQGANEEELLRVIDPDDRYALTGDRAEQRFDAQSRYPVYLRAEKGGTQALIGDYDTQLSQTQLGRYDRRLTGARLSSETGRYGFTAFAAETAQDFMRDEIAADGTSGPYRLDAAPLIRNSELIVIETRDAFRPDIVTAQRPLVRYVDYDIDFDTGELIFRAPVPAGEGLDTHNVIVATYETRGLGGDALTAGARGTARFADDRVQLGATVIHEEGGARRVEASVAAADIVVRVSEATTVRAELGVSRRDGDEATALLVEAEHAGQRVTGRAYFAEVETGYGVGQQSSALSGARRYGAEGTVRLAERDVEGKGRILWGLEAEAYREDNLDTGASRSLASVALSRDAGTTRLETGLRAVAEETAAGEERRSALLTNSLRQVFPEHGLTISLAHDQPLTGEDSTLFPRRTTVGVEQIFFDRITAKVQHSVLEVGEGETGNTLVGLEARPLQGMTLSASADMLTQDDARRIGATFGADQQVKLTENVTASLTVTRRVELDNDSVLEPVGDIVPDDPVSPLEGTEEYLSVAAGLAYRSEVTVASIRAETRDGTLGQRNTQVLGAARELSETLSLAGAVRLEQTDNKDAANTRRARARIGTAYRPRAEGAIVLHRLDLEQEEATGELRRWHAVNNLSLTTEWGERTEIAAAHAVKYAEIDANGVSASGLTQFAALETRFDVTERVDVGLRGSLLYDHEGDALSYSYGPSVGVAPAKGVWVGLGYNVSGHDESGFEAAEYTEQGAYLRVRLRFDQDTAKGLLNLISPKPDPR